MTRVGAVLRTSDMAYTAHPVWYFQPNWDQGVLERLSWKTDHLVSETLAEQRVTRRLTPRRTYEASFLIPEARQQEFQVLMAASHRKRMVLPIWPDISRLQASASAGTNTLSLDTRWREFVVGSLVMLVNRKTGAWEVHTVNSKTDSSLTLVSNLELDWGKGASVYPAAFARMTDQQSAPKITDTAIKFDCEFLFDQRNVHSGFWMSDKDYRGTSILDLAPDESEDLTSEHQRLLTTVDNELGLPSVVDVPARGLERRTYRWAYASAEKREEFRRFLYYLCGKRRTVWLPSFMNDFTVSQDIDAYQSTLRVKNAGYTETGMPVEGKRDIRIRLTDGYEIYRRILSSSIISSEIEELTLDAPFFFGVAKEQIGTISFVSSCRLDHDTVEIDHRTDAEGLAVSVLTFVREKEPGSVSLTSRPYPISPIDSLDVSATMADGFLVEPPTEPLDFSVNLEPTGILFAYFTVTYTFWPFESIDFNADLEPTGTLRPLLVTYTNGVSEAVDFNTDLEPTGTLLVKLISYGNWPVEAVDFSADLEPTGTLA